MSVHLTTFEGSVTDAIREAIERAVADARVEVAGGGGHFSITVTSPAFAGQPMVQSHRAVLAAIKHLMHGDDAPVHAVDKLVTRTP